ncbi:MAG TPA: calcium/sodium antiporter [bacterium]|nr:calcium/sodium antiporter [bacterium]
MPFWLNILVGFAALVVGADLLVRGSSKIAAGFGVPPVVIGLTLVAYGTSAPEFAVSTAASLRGAGAIALGNVTGSNIANIGLILGLASLVRPLEVESTLVKREAPLLILLSLGVPLLFLGGVLERWAGILLFAGGIGFTWWSLASARSGADRPVREKLVARDWLLNLLFVGAGLAGLFFGGRWLVSGAVEMAGRLGVSERVIGLTIVAVGTSLPELATSMVAAVKGESDIAVGNIVGSNIFNLLFVLGGAATLAPFAADVRWPGVWPDFLVALVFAAILWPFARSGRRLERWEGGVLIALYAAFVAFTVLNG